MAAAFAVSCVQFPNTYVPRGEREPMVIEKPVHQKTFLNMNDQDAPRQFVRGVGIEVFGGAWRWAGQEAVIDFGAVKSGRAKFVADATVPEITFKDTGPVTISVAINGARLETIVVNRSGDIRFEKDVPPELLRRDVPNTATFTIDRLWTRPGDGQTFGFILTRAGFVEKK